MEQEKKYSIHLKAKYGFLEPIDVPALAAQVTDDWYNQTLCRVNDCVVRLGVFQKGAFHWHRHEMEAATVTPTGDG